MNRQSSISPTASCRNLSLILKISEKSNSKFSHSHFTLVKNSDSNTASWAAVGELGSNVEGTQGTQRSTLIKD